MNASSSAARPGGQSRGGGVAPARDREYACRSANSSASSADPSLEPSSTSTRLVGPARLRFDRAEERGRNRASFRKVTTTIRRTGNQRRRTGRTSGLRAARSGPGPARAFFRGPDACDRMPVSTATSRGLTLLRIAALSVLIGFAARSGRSTDEPAAAEDRAEALRPPGDTHVLVDLRASKVTDRANRGPTSTPDDPRRPLARHGQPSRARHIAHLPACRPTTSRPCARHGGVQSVSPNRAASSGRRSSCSPTALPARDPEQARDSRSSTSTRRLRRRRRPRAWPARPSRGCRLPERAAARAARCRRPGPAGQLGRARSGVLNPGVNQARRARFLVAFGLSCSLLLLWAGAPTPSRRPAPRRRGAHRVCPLLRLWLAPSPPSARDLRWPALVPARPVALPRAPGCVARPGAVSHGDDWPRTTRPAVDGGRFHRDALARPVRLDPAHRVASHRPEVRPVGACPSSPSCGCWRCFRAVPTRRAYGPPGSTSRSARW